MATQNNAPMPSPVGPAEIFDDTIGPPQPVLSRDSIPAPSPVEGTVHAGQINDVDPFLRGHYMVQTTVTWSTNQSAGTKLYQVPIHPQESHQWLAHLNKMYNTWDGSIDYAIKVAGTGFHAGALMVAYLPPNIDPSKINTPQDLSAFDYKIIDPKTLQVEVQTLRDQRNIMFHWNPLLLTDKQSFGGWMILMVSIPLNTSSSGATQIAIQIYSKPSMNFKFNQLIPVTNSIIPTSDYLELVKILDFSKGLRHDPVTERPIISMETYSQKSKLYLDHETYNCYKFDGTVMNGKYFPPLFSNLPIKTEKFVTHGIKTKPADKNWFINIEPIATINFGSIIDTADIKSKVYLTGKVSFYLEYTFNLIPPDTEPARMLLFLEGTSEIVDGDMIVTISRPYHDQEPYGTGFYYYNFGTEGPVWPAETGEISNILKDYYLGVSFQTGDIASDGMVKYAPPIAENLVTFVSEGRQSAQPSELAQYLKYAELSNSVSKNQALLFELIDLNVDLPIMTFKLHWDGYFTVPSSTVDVKYDFTKNSYAFKYVGKSNEVDPMYLSPKLTRNFYQVLAGAPSPPEIKR